MLETILKLYTMAMANDVRSPLPHLFGPPGCGKSTAVEQAAKLIGCRLHIINVSRISPLELEGVQMPITHGDGMKLSMLTATFWTQLQEGDILLLDEFLRGFPEVYNGLLDILTSRQVAGYQLPKVFIIGASNSTVAYDKALEDRLLHLPVPDPRKSKAAKRRLAELLVDSIGLLPDMRDSFEMQTLLDTEVLPMYELLDQIRGKASSASGTINGTSLRNLIGQAQLRHVKSIQLRELLAMNNTRAIQADKAQFVVLLDGRNSVLSTAYRSRVEKLQQLQPGVLTELQARNLALNLQLMELESARNEKGVEDEEHDDIDLDELI